MKIENRKKFIRRIKAIPVEVRASIQKDLRTGANEMVEVAKRFAPKDDGVLAATIRAHKGRRALQMIVRAGGRATTTAGANGAYDYALAQEHGTQEMHAQQFFWPAYRLTKRRRNSRVTRNANKIIKKRFGAK